VDVGSNCISQSSVSELTFTNSSVASDCNDVLVSEISKQIYRGTEPQRLSSNFVNFNSFLFYAVHNSMGADVGVIVSDGIQVDFENPAITSVTICLEYDPSLISSEYPVLDMAER
jgi:hypothetical protein